MNDTELLRLIQACVTGEIDPDDHQRLQEKLKADPEARAVFREAMDIEASLRTWATEEPPVNEQKTALRVPNRLRTWSITLTAIATTAAAVLLAFFLRNPSDNTPDIARVDTYQGNTTTHIVGTVRHARNCTWATEPALNPGSRVSTGTLSLASGTVELEFTSGTDLVLEGPCELEIVSTDTARLLAGDILVNVTELSDGFILETPDATIIDEGTEYAVSLSNEATEVHVYDGSVFWEPIDDGEDGDPQRIVAGEARRYGRGDARQGARIPLRDRIRVWQMEQEVQEEASGKLQAYDGFENLAGRIRRGRSGFGWSGGWEPEGQAPGDIATIVDTPHDVVFGMNRDERRQLALADGESIQRDLQEPIVLAPGNTCFISLLLQRDSSNAESGCFFQVSLPGDESFRGRRAQRHAQRHIVFGVTSEGFPFIKNGGIIEETAPAIKDEVTYLCVAKISAVDEQSVETSLRLYRSDESVDSSEPTVWTLTLPATSTNSDFSCLRLSVGDNAQYEIDELKIGPTWRSVIPVDPEIGVR